MVTGVSALFASGCGLLSTAAPAAASGNLQSMFEDPNIETPTNSPAFDPTPDLQLLRYLGVNLVRLNVPWYAVAPNPTSSAVPSVNLSDPNSYNWSWIAKDVNVAHRLGISVDLILTGGAPTWALGPNPPSGAQGGNWEPSANYYGQFVRAAGTEFKSVNFFELWNEANWGPGMAPQFLNSSLPVGAKYYRALVDAGWNALHATGHAHATISIGNLSQDGSPPSEFGTAAPLSFMKTLYCLSNAYKPLSGSAAGQAGCPNSKGAFKRAHPALFGASGVGIHPYPYGNRPSKTLFPNPNGAEFGEIPQFTRGLDRIVKAYGSRKRLAVYNTEYGYATRPPETKSYYATPNQAAAYINQAQYLSWKNPRVGTYDQYTIVDSSAWFKTGLFFLQGTSACPGAVPCPKPSFYAYRLPIWTPVSKAKRGHALEVWGQARAAGYARIDTGHPQYVQIQFARKGSRGYRTVKKVRLSNRYGYFDTHVRFPGSGSVRLTWSYPPSDANLFDPLASDPGFPAALKSSRIYSRTTTISLH
jgi:hypothetical protein